MIKKILRRFKPLYKWFKRVLNFIPAAWKRKKINYKHFSVICNNCWGGVLYQQFGMKYESPTIGCVIPPKDFIRLCQDLESYLSKEIVPLDIECSHNRELFKTLEYSHHKKLILGTIGDVEICFLHYKTFKDAVEKWDKRKRRISNPILIKFNDNNGMSIEDLENFNQIAATYKTIFTTYRQDYYDFSNANVKFLLPYKLKDQDGVDDVFKFKKKFNAVKVINELLE